MIRKDHKLHDFFIFTLFLWVFFLAAELIFRVNNLYLTFPNIDIAAHFLSGMAFSASAYLYLSSRGIGRKAKIALSILATFSMAILWEILETLQETIMTDPPHLQDYFFWDGFWDVVVEIIGAIVILLLMKALARTRWVRKHQKE